jgi:hypothetical protein
VSTQLQLKNISISISSMPWSPFAATESVPENLDNLHTLTGLSAREDFIGGEWLFSHPGQFTPGKVPRCPLIPQLVWTFWGREKLLSAEADKV